MAIDGAITLATALKDAVCRLDATSDTARLDARLLLQHVTGLSHADMIGWPDHALRTEEATHFEALVSRRTAGEPVSQIIGEKEFWGLPFQVTADVLTPRPDSESLIELALELMKGTPPQRILDLGTGSGCLLAALLSEFPETTGTGVDISPEALAIAARNIAALGLDGRTTLLEQDFAAPLDGEYDLIVSNPPYIPQGDRESLSVEVREHEPALALFAGEEGLDAYRILSHMLPERLAPDGVAILEAGAGQSEEIIGLMKAGFTAGGRDITVHTRQDLAGHERAIALVAR